MSKRDRNEPSIGTQNNFGPNSIYRNPGANFNFGTQAVGQQTTSPTYESDQRRDRPVSGASRNDDVEGNSAEVFDADAQASRGGAKTRGLTVYTPADLPSVLTGLSVAELQRRLGRASTVGLVVSVLGLLVGVLSLAFTL
jgi:hypothetical protein